MTTGIILDRYRYAPPSSAEFTHNFDDGTHVTVTDTSDRGMNVTFGSYASATLRGVAKVMNAATNQSIVARLDSPRWGYNYHDAGGLFLSDGTKILTFVQDWRASSPGFYIDQWNSASSSSSELLSGNSDNMLAEMEWFRIDVVNGHPYNFMASTNGTDWLTIYQSSNSWLGSTPWYVGFIMQVNHSSGTYPVSGTNEAYVNVLYYKDLDIVPTV